MCKWHNGAHDRSFKCDLHFSAHHFFQLIVSPPVEEGPQTVQIGPQDEPEKHNTGDRRTPVHHFHHVAVLDRVEKAPRFSYGNSVSSMFSVRDTQLSPDYLLPWPTRLTTWRRFCRKKPAESCPTAELFRPSCT